VPRASYTSAMPLEDSRPAVGLRPRGFVSVRGPGAEDYLQRMVSNDVAALGAGEACDALLLTPKARVIAPLTVVRRTDQDFLLLTEPELPEVVRSHLLAFRFAARLDVEVEEHESFLLLGGAPPAGATLSVETTEYGEPAFEVLDAAPPGHLSRISEEQLERLRIVAGTPRFGREIDDRVLPAEAGLVERAVSLTKGCYPGQEPIARLHYRGHANRSLRVLRVETDSPLPPDAEVRLGDKVVGRVTSSAPANGALVALAYVRTEVPPEAELAVGDSAALPLDG
jgi:folate-binding protein YgfZ